MMMTLMVKNAKSPESTILKELKFFNGMEVTGGVADAIHWTDQRLFRKQERALLFDFFEKQFSVVSDAHKKSHCPPAAPRSHVCCRLYWHLIYVHFCVPLSRANCFIFKRILFLLCTRLHFQEFSQFFLN